MEINSREQVEETIMIMLNEALKLPVGSKERSAAIEDVSKLLHNINEEDRNQGEYAIKQDQLQEQRKQNERDTFLKKVSLWLSGGTLFLGASELISQIVMSFVGMKFEETGSIRSFFNRQNNQNLFKKHNFKTKV